MRQGTSTAPLSRKNQHTAAIPPAVIPVHTGIHSSTHARCHIWKRTCHNRQQHHYLIKISTPPPYPSCHSRAHGNPFIHTRQMRRLETHLPQPTTT
ncbi:DUF4842 domain-containing protein [Vibrio vulnificus]|uniref:DUF4842 domain-containing protein n=1 Tax=Vibrio vulnificus TaxID=672 RepID=UPI003CC66173